MTQSSLTFSDTIKLLFTKRMFVVLLLGFASGLPAELTRSTLQAWYTVSGISIVSIGLLGLVGLPYVYKFLWAPVIDRYLPPFLGRRTGWLLVTQLLLLILIIIMSFLKPQYAPVLLAIVALCITFTSASQDIALDAYRTDFFSPVERAPSTSFYVAGYRVAMLVAGGVALILAQELGWHITFLLMALCIGFGIIGTFLAEEPKDQIQPPTTLKKAVIEPFKEFLSRKHAILLLVFIIIYKLSFAGILMMTPVFLLRDLGFSLIDVGTVNKGVAVVATLMGVFLGGVTTARIGVFRALIIFAILQAVGNLSFMWLAMVGKNFPLMVSSITIVNFFAGMEASAFVAFLMGLCDKRYTATQYALLSALALIGNAIIGPIAGEVVAHFGWAHFFLWTFVIAIPGIMILFYLKRTEIFVNGDALVSEN